MGNLFSKLYHICTGVSTIYNLYSALVYETPHQFYFPRREQILRFLSIFWVLYLSRSIGSQCMENRNLVHSRLFCQKVLSFSVFLYAFSTESMCCSYTSMRAFEYKGSNFGFIIRQGCIIDMRHISKSAACVKVRVFILLPLRLFCDLIVLPRSFIYFRITHSQKKFSG